METMRTHQPTVGSRVERQPKPQRLANPHLQDHAKLKDLIRTTIKVHILTARKSKHITSIRRNIPTKAQTNQLTQMPRNKPATIQPRIHLMHNPKTPAHNKSDSKSTTANHKQQSAPVTMTIMNHPRTHQTNPHYFHKPSIKQLNTPHKWQW
eukprot:gene3228-2210_t